MGDYIVGFSLIQDIENRPHVIDSYVYISRSEIRTSELIYAWYILELANNVMRRTL